MRTILVAIAALFVAVGLASAQVAAPSLNPTSVVRLDADLSVGAAAQNPAVLAWDGPSRVAASYGPAKYDNLSPLAPASPDAKGNATGLQARLVGEMFAAGLEVLKAKFDFDALAGGGSMEFGGQSIGLAAQFGKWFSVGLGQEVHTFKDSSPVDNKETVPLLGATARFGETIYLGAALGTATVKDQTSSTPEGKSSVTRYGVAYAKRDKTNGVHLELYHAERAGKADPGAITVDEVKTNALSAEVLWTSFLIGVGSSTSKSVVPGTGPGTGPRNEVKQSMVSLGYVPEKGLSIVASMAKDDFKSPSTGNVTDKTEVISVGVAWLF